MLTNKKWLGLLLLTPFLWGCGKADAQPTEVSNKSDPSYVTVSDTIKQAENAEKLIIAVTNEDCKECESLLEWLSSNDQYVNYVKIVNLSEASQEEIDQLLELEPNLNKFPSLLLVSNGEMIRHIDQIDTQSLDIQLEAFLE